MKFKLRRDSTATNNSPTSSQNRREKEKENEFVPPPMSPLQLMLQSDLSDPIRSDGNDKYFGMENPQFGNTCYCNSILQCLYYSVPFRNGVISYPRRSSSESLNEALSRNIHYPTPESIREDLMKPLRPKQATPSPGRTPASTPPQPQRPEDKDSSDYRKRAAMATLPIMETTNNAPSYGMEESIFTSLKDIFESIVATNERIGVIKPNHFLDFFQSEYDMFRNSMQQDAHEFLNLLLNEVVKNVEAHDQRMRLQSSNQHNDSKHVSVDASKMSGSASIENNKQTSARWVHELFEGILTSETQCLTCEKKSQRDEVFLDLSVDLDKNSSVTSCLRKFSADEMLCGREKFHCDNCGGLQEAEKRMVIKRPPRILALHLKRFKYTEDMQRFHKLFHRVVYPYYLRLFNTTDDTEDPDALYELYAVVVHIGGSPYHGHYVAIIKTQERGWLLFDDELVEPVDRSFVRNFFGDRPGLACAYVLFYQQTTSDAMERENEREEMRDRAQRTGSAHTGGTSNGSGNGFGLGITGPTNGANATEAAAESTESPRPQGVEKTRNYVNRLKMKFT